MFSINKPKVISNSVGGEVIVINLDSGCYYNFNKSAGILWNAVISGADVNNLKSQYTEKIGFKDSDFDSFINKLLEEELVVSCNDISGNDCKPDLDGLDKSDLPPVIEKFDDMQELLILDPIHEVGEDGWPFKN